MTWARGLEWLALIGLAAALLFTVYDYGSQTKDAEWKQRWADRDAGDRQAWAIAESEEREREQARQQSINKVIQDGQKAIDSASADAASARSTADSLRRQVDRLSSVAESSNGSYSCTSAASQAASRAVMVLADVLKRADARAGDLAEHADQSRVRGLNCEAAYEGIVN